jgi:hypothetical protein
MQEKHKRIIEVFVETMSDSLADISKSENLEEITRIFENIEQDAKVVIKLLEKLTRVNK